MLTEWIRPIDQMACPVCGEPIQGDILAQPEEYDFIICMGCRNQIELEPYVKLTVKEPLNQI